MQDPIVGTMIWVLRLSVALTCIGTGYYDLLGEGPLFKILWMGLGWSEDTALAITHGGAYLMMGCAPLILFRRAWPVLPLVSAWMALRMIGQFWDEVWYPFLVPMEWSVRLVGPVALAFVEGFPRNGAIPPGRIRTTEWMIRVSVALTFVGHGLGALFLKAGFIDLIIASGREFLFISIEESTAKTLLLAIGILDLGVAAALVLPVRVRSVAAWMAFWGFITALSRFARFGEEGWHLVVLRALNGGAPLALYLYWHSLKRRDREGRKPHED